MPRAWKPWPGGDRQRLGLAVRGSAEKKRRIDAPPAAPVPAAPAPPAAAPAPPEELREVVRDLFLMNEISGETAHRLAASGHRSGASGVADLAVSGSSGSQKGNLARDILSKLTKTCTGPHLYFADIPVLDVETNTSKLVAFPFLLPHETIDHLFEDDNFKPAFVTAASHPALYNVFEPMCKLVGLVPARVLPIGLHGDGVPFSNTDSLEQLSWNFPAVPSSPRFLFSAVSKNHCVDGRTTLEAMLTIFVWSMNICLSGLWPSVRHDGAVFHIRQDQGRAAKAMKPLRFKALLVEFRADWSWLKQVLSFPSWSNKFICWRCKACRDPADPSDYQNTTLEAEWRRDRYQPGQFLRLMKDSNVPISALFSLPGFTEQSILQDWLHVVDLGVAQDHIGNLFHEVAEKLPGATRADRVHALFLKIRQFYREQPARTCHLNHLTPEMIKPEGQGPKLRAKGAETRHLIKFAASLAREQAGDNAHDRAVVGLFDSLLTLANLVASPAFDKAAAASASRKYCALATALRTQALAADENSKFWKCKPKMHMLQELVEYTCMERGSPAGFWTYADESWCGWLKRRGHSRGGRFVPEAHAERLLHRYRALHQITSPSLRG